VSTIARPKGAKDLQPRRTEGYHKPKSEQHRQKLSQHLQKVRRSWGEIVRGKPSKLKGRTYEQILGTEGAKIRKQKASLWMSSDRNIRRYARHPSKPQLRLFESVKKKFPDAILEHPVILSNGKTIWLDIAVPSLKIDIEYDGKYWHRLNQVQGWLDSDRDRLLRELGWEVVRTGD
jgi:hypothetical protein